MGLFDRLKNLFKADKEEKYVYSASELSSNTVKESKTFVPFGSLLKDTSGIFPRREKEFEGKQYWEKIKTLIKSEKPEEKNLSGILQQEAFKKILETDNKLKEIMEKPITVEEEDFKASLANVSQQEALKKILEARLGPKVYGEKQVNEIRKQIENMADLLAKLKSDNLTDNVKLAEAVKLKAEAIENSYKYSTFKALNPQDYKNSYDSFVRHMNDEVIKEINREIIGSYVHIGSSFQKILNETKSFNELLNLVHTYVTENGILLSGLNKWGEHENLQAFGEETPIARRIFEELKNNKINLATIFSFGDTVHITARDFGHALSITIEGQEGKELTVEYKIPKAFGRNFVEHLRGFKIYDSEGDTARGNFFLPPSDIGTALAKFIKQVPRDATTIEDIEKFKQENALEQEKEIQAQIAEEKNIKNWGSPQIFTKQKGDVLARTFKGWENIGQFFQKIAEGIGKKEYGRAVEAVAAKLEQPAQEPVLETGEVMEEYPQGEQEPEQPVEEPAEEEYQESGEYENVPPPLPKIVINMPDKIPKDIAKKLESKGIKIPKNKIK